MLTRPPRAATVRMGLAAGFGILASDNGIKGPPLPVRAALRPRLDFQSGFQRRLSAGIPVARIALYLLCATVQRVTALRPPRRVAPSLAAAEFPAPRRTAPRPP